MTEIPNDLLLQQGPLVLALILSHAGLFLAAWFVLGLVRPLRGTPSIICALSVSTSATPVFGLAVLEPILGPTSGGAVGLVALAINLTVPPAVILLEIDAATKHRGATTAPSHSSAIRKGLNAGLKSPLLWAPILGVTVVLASIPLPRVVTSCLNLIGSTTSGVAVLIGSLARISVQSAVLFVLLLLMKVNSPFARETLVFAVFHWPRRPSCSPPAIKPSSPKPLRCFSSRLSP